MASCTPLTTRKRVSAWVVIGRHRRASIAAISRVVPCHLAFALPLVYSFISLRSDAEPLVACGQLLALVSEVCVHPIDGAILLLLLSATRDRLVGYGARPGCSHHRQEPLMACQQFLVELSASSYRVGCDRSEHFACPQVG